MQREPLSVFSQRPIPTSLTQGHRKEAAFYCQIAFLRSYNKTSPFEAVITKNSPINPPTK